MQRRVAQRLALLQAGRLAMSTTVRDYLDEVEHCFYSLKVVHSFQIREREERLHEGFIRIRAVLTNGDVLEAFEFVVATPDAVQTQSRIGCTGSKADGRLKRRWDNAPHHRDVSTFPHHVHDWPNWTNGCNCYANDDFPEGSGILERVA